MLDVKGFKERLVDFTLRKVINLKKNIDMMDDDHVIFKVKLIIKVGDAGISPPLGPIISSYQINTSDFCKEFNEKSLILYLEDIEVPLIMEVTKDKSFFLFLKNLSMNYLINLELRKFTNSYRSIDLITLLDIIKFKYREIPVFNIKTLTKNLFGFLNSVKIKIK